MLLSTPGDAQGPEHNLTPEPAPRFLTRNAGLSNACACRAVRLTWWPRVYRGSPQTAQLQATFQSKEGTLPPPRAGS